MPSVGYAIRGRGEAELRPGESELRLRPLRERSVAEMRLGRVRGDCELRPVSVREVLEASARRGRCEGMARRR